ncbi:MAG: ribosome biogenesis GTPase Der [Planctomycetota bacterium]
MSVPRVVIVGRPNVGKSTLLNRLARRRISIVEPSAGVTRDRISVFAEIPTAWQPRNVELIDTGGVGVVDRHDLGPHVDEQIRAALLLADVVLFVVDVREGVCPLDRAVAERLRGFAKPVLVVVNKVEGEKLEWDVDQFYQLGIGDRLLPISAQNGTGLSDLYEALSDALPADTGEAPALKPALRVAVVGRRNAGKSTLVNAIARDERVIVSEIPGTTRDAVDVIVERDGKSFVLIDTAGIRKKGSHEDAVEFYSDVRSHAAIRRADAVLILFDVTRTVSAIEKRLARYVVDHHKTVLLGANKLDLAKDVTPEDFREYLDQELPGLAWAPVSFLSAKEGINVDGTFALLQELHNQALTRVGTGELNRVVQRALTARSPSKKGYRVNVKYVTQVDIAPPTFILFVNDKRLIGKDFLRYLENRFREELPIGEVPVRLILRDKHHAPFEDAS